MYAVGLFLPRSRKFFLLDVLPFFLKRSRSPPLRAEIQENLSPFMFEVPRAFGAFDSLFKNLGTTQAPNASDYAVFLKVWVITMTRLSQWASCPSHVQAVSNRTAQFMLHS